MATSAVTNREKGGQIKRDGKEVSKFVSSKLSPIEDVTGTSTQFVLKKYKDHGTIMFGQKKTERMLVTP